MDPFHYIVRAASRMTYQATYAASMILPARNKRAKKARARAFAAKAEANAQKHAPAGIAVALNLFVLGLLGTAKFREEHEKDDQAIEAVVDNEGFFVRTTPKAEPPSGGGGGGSAAAAVAAGAQNIAINVPNTPSPIDLGALTT